MPTFAPPISSPKRLARFPLNSAAAAALALTGMLGAPGLMRTAQAQSVPDAGQLLQQIPALRQAPAATPPRIGVTPPRSDAPAADGPALVLQAVDFDGDTAGVDLAPLRALVQPRIGSRLGLAALQALADELAQPLRARGFALAQVVLPAQEVQQGRVRYTIQLGRLDGTAADGGVQVASRAARLRPALPQALVRQALGSQADAPLQMAALERGLLLVNELPGVSAVASLERGSAPGTARLVVQVDEGPLVTGSVVADNGGNRYTGAARLTGSVALLDPTGRGDLAQVQLSAAERSHALNAAYSLPLGAAGWRGGISLNTLRYRLGEELAPLDARGTAHGVGLSASWAVQRSRDSALTFTGELEHRRLADDSLGQALARKRSTALTLGLNGSRQDSSAIGGVTQGSLSLGLGRIDLGGVAAALAADQAGPRVQGSFAKLGLTLARLQPVTAGTALFVGLRGQAASTNLDSSERLQLGGPGGVRAYPAGEGSVDEGLLLNVELRHDLPLRSALGALQLMAFIDGAHARQHHRTWAGWNAGNPGQANSVGLAGAGIGANLTRGAVTLRGAWAWKLGHNPLASAAGNDADGQQRRGRLWLQAAITL
jgi:hemolysin activation/secretion protein